MTEAGSGPCSLSAETTSSLVTVPVMAADTSVMSLFSHLSLLWSPAGISHGSVVAGVIGAKKPQYDIWGKTVNLASRMDSTGVSGRIQVPEETYLILKDQGFAFDYRGEIYVKGISEQEGKIKTYFLLGRVQPNPFILPPRRLPGQYSLAAVVLGLVQSLNRQRQKQLLNEDNNTGIIKAHYNRRTLLAPSGPEPGAPAEGTDKSNLP